MTPIGSMREGIQISPAAAARIREMSHEVGLNPSECALRVRVVPSGGSEFLYSLSLDRPGRDDFSFACQGARAVVEKTIAALVDGAVLDFETTLQGRGFRITPAPFWIGRPCLCGSANEA